MGRGGDGRGGEVERKGIHGHGEGERCMGMGTKGEQLQQLHLLLNYYIYFYLKTYLTAGQGNPS